MALRVVLLAQKVQLTAGIYAVKASRHVPGHLCERFHDPNNGHFFIPGVPILSRGKFCVQEVLLHICLLPSHLNALFGLRMDIGGAEEMLKSAR